MEFDTDLYKRACSKLTVPPEKIQEVIAMTEKQRKPRRWTKRMLVAAGVTALAVVTAMGANAASGGGLFAQLVSCVEYEMDGESFTAMTFEVDYGLEGQESQGEFQVYQEGEDGKAVLAYIDENGNKVTQELDLDGSSAAKAPAVQLEDGHGQLSPVEVESIELNTDHSQVTVQYTDAQGRAGSAVLVLPEDCQGYESLGEVLAGKSALSGKTLDGRSYVIEQK